MTEFNEQPHVRRFEETDDLAHKREHARRLDEVISKGKVNWGGSFSLAQSVNTTTVQDDRVTRDSVIVLYPTSNYAASIINRLYVKTLSPGVPWAANALGQFVLEHPIVANALYTFRYLVTG